MTREELLKQYRLLVRDLNEEYWIYEGHRARAERATGSISDTPKARGDGQREAAICEMVDSSREIQFLMGRLERVQRELLRKGVKPWEVMEDD